MTEVDALLKIAETIEALVVTVWVLNVLVLIHGVTRP